MRIGAGVEGFTPDAVGDDSIEYVDAVIAMDQVDVGIRIFDRLAATKKPARVAAATDQPGKADDGRAKLPTLPEQVLDDDQRMLRRLLAHLFGNEFAAIGVHRRGTHEQHRLDRGGFDFPQQALEAIDILRGDVDDQRARLQKGIDIVQGFTDVDDVGFARQGGERRQASRGRGRCFQPVTLRHETLGQRQPEPAAAQKTDGFDGVTSDKASSEKGNIGQTNRLLSTSQINRGLSPACSVELGIMPRISRYLSAHAILDPKPGPRPAPRSLATRAGVKFLPWPDLGLARGHRTDRRHGQQLSLARQSAGPARDLDTALARGNCQPVPLQRQDRAIESLGHLVPALRLRAAGTGQPAATSG